MIVGVPCRVLDFKENLEILKKIGYDGFQLDLATYGIDTLSKNFTFDSEDDKAIKEIKKLTDKLKFPVLAFHTFFPLNSSDLTARTTLQKCEYYLRELNCKTLILHISGYSKDKKQLEQAIRCLKNMNKNSLEQYDILLENDHEPSLFITEKDIESTNKDLNFNLCFDVTHAMQANVNLDSFYKKFKQKIKAFHISDYKDGKPHKEIGTGILNTYKCYNEIKKSNFLKILEVGKDIKKANTKKEMVIIYKDSYNKINN